VGVKKGGGVVGGIMVVRDLWRKKAFWQCDSVLVYVVLSIAFGVRRKH
jgi:hypothetical protein